jgi:hypothetical protein
LKAKLDGGKVKITTAKVDADNVNELIVLIEDFKPDVVLNFTATAGNKQVSLSWDAPSGNGGSEITGYEVTTDNWTNKVSKSANERSHIYTDLTNNTAYTFKIRAVNAQGAGQESTATATPVLHDMVLINGVKWATRNVDMPGIFAAESEDYGMFYQWNRKIGYSNSDPLTNTEWSNIISESPEWETANDPSPSGFRAPTLQELQSLLESDKVTKQWTTQNGINGYKFTDKNNGNNIFLPAAGNRSYGDATLQNRGSWGNYWSSSPYNIIENNYNAYFLNFISAGIITVGCERRFGQSIRSVLK